MAKNDNTTTYLLLAAGAIALYYLYEQGDLQAWFPSLFGGTAATPTVASTTPVAVATTTTTPAAAITPVNGQQGIVPSQSLTQPVYPAAPATYGGPPTGGGNVYGEVAGFNAGSPQLAAIISAVNESHPYSETPAGKAAAQAGMYGIGRISRLPSRMIHGPRYRRRAG